MNRATVAGMLFAVVPLVNGCGGADDKDALNGVWVAQSMEAGGQAAPEKDVKRMRFTFNGEKVLVRGNFDDDTEEECAYTIDPKQSPKQLDMRSAKEKNPVLAIYEVKGDELKICLRHGNSTGGRPAEFTTKGRDDLVLIVLKRQKS